MYTLYGSRGSGSAAAECGLEMAGVDYRIVAAATWEPGPALDELTRVNPLHQIPTLVLPSGQVMTESAAILMHLGLAFPQSGLLSEEPAERDRALRGLVYIPANCYSCITVIDYPERFTTATDDAARAAVREGTRARLHHHWDVFADQFPVDGDRFLGGTQPGALDILAAVVSKWSGTRQHLKTSRPAFSALLERIESHPSVALVFGRHWPTAAELPTGA
ncbi:MAG TPA: glutathione S-transferase family protein [Burkholderiaceae bacterium]